MTGVQTCALPICLYPFARFPSCGIFIPTRTSSVNNELKQQGDGAGETSITTNYELQGTGRATRAPVAQTLQTVRQTCSRTTTTCSYRFARFPSCGIFTPTRTIPLNNELKQQGDGAGEHLKKRQITSWRARAGQHARPSHKHCKPCAKHAHAPPPRGRSCLHDFHLVEFSYQPVPSQCTTS